MDAKSDSDTNAGNGAKTEQSLGLENDLRQCREELRLETVGHSEFLARLNQQLRTPLNAIMGFAELLEMQCENASAADKDNAKQILKAARDLLDVINRELAAHRKDNDASSVTANSQCDVLYIEDDPVNFALVERILEHRPGVKVLQAKRGETGVSLAQTQGPKLILLDLNLPDIHGAEVLQRLQQSSTTAQVPVVVLSADATASQIERLLSAGARNYLTKPFSIQPLLAVVDEFLGENVARSR
jgi:CheY-like chemotaxis protein